MDRYAVIGNPIGHSKSPKIHSTFAETTGQSLEYTTIEGREDTFETTVCAFREQGGRGMNGAARGAVLPFLAQRPAKLTIANRDLDKVQTLVRDAGKHSNLRAVGYRDIADERFDLVVNAMSASLRGELPPVSPRVFGEGALAYELVYGKGLTPSLRLAQNAGVSKLADGVGRLPKLSSGGAACARTRGP